MRSAKSLQGVSKKEQADKKADKAANESDLDVAEADEHREAIKNNATVRNDLYYSFLRRVRKNFKLIFNFTPSGYDFREKMEHHKNLVINSQMIWI